MIVLIIPSLNGDSMLLDTIKKHPDVRKKLEEKNVNKRIIVSLDSYIEYMGSAPFDKKCSYYDAYNKKLSNI